MSEVYLRQCQLEAIHIVSQGDEATRAAMDRLDTWVPVAVQDPVDGRGSTAECLADLRIGVVVIDPEDVIDPEEEACPGDCLGTQSAVGNERFELLALLRDLNRTIGVSSCAIQVRITGQRPISVYSVVTLCVSCKYSCHREIENSFSRR